ncbi:MAG: chromate transporter, partial [Rhizobacter sp.]|nr:chromate transporter [Rhizobacter sp.]
TIAIGAALLVLVLSSAFGQVAAMVLGGLAGLRMAPLSELRGPPHRDCGVGKATGLVLLVVFAGLLAGLPLLASALNSMTLSAVAAFYKAGALVFGGGHVVLPLLQASVVPSGWLSNESFLAGYGATQAVPGPLFTFAAYLGSAMNVPPRGWQGGLLMLVAIFLPAFLLVAGTLPFWEQLRAKTGVRRAMAGVNAAVVGVLAAALYDPVWTSAIHARSDFALALAAFGLLVVGKVSPVWVVLFAAVAGWALSLGMPGAG